MAITFSAEVTFDETLSPPELLVEDTTDYAGQSVPVTDLADKLQVTLQGSNGTTIVYPFPSGNTYDILLNTGTTNLNPIYLPLDSDGKILEGTYKLEIANYDTLTDLPTGDTATFTYVFKRPCPKAELSVEVDCAASTITATDDTDYGSYVDTLDRTLNVYAPPVLGLPAYTTSQETLVVTGIYTKTWTAEVISIVTYEYPTYTAIIEVTGTKEFDVECDSDGCKILCCLKELYTTYTNLACVNPTAANIMWNSKIKPVTEQVAFFQLARSCGDSDKAAYFLANIISISGCTTDCKGCGANDAPTPVVPTTPTNNITVVDSPDNSIAVTSSTVGVTTTYHVQISNAIQALIAAAYNTTVDTTTPTYIDVTTSGSNPVNYRVNYVGPDPQLYGFPYTFLSAVTATNPGSGNLKFDNANLNLATALYISNTEGNSNVITALLTMAGASSLATKSYITVRSATDEADYCVFAVTGVTNNTGWFTFDLTFQFTSANAPFSNNDDVLVTIDVVGDAGNPVNASRQIYSSTSVVASGDTGGSPVVQKSTTILAQYMDTVGDVCVLEADFRLSSGTLGQADATLQIPGYLGYVISLGYVTATGRIHLEFTRTGGNTFSVTGWWTVNGSTYVINIAQVTGLTTSDDIPVECAVTTSGTDVDTARFFIEYKPPL